METPTGIDSREYVEEVHVTGADLVQKIRDLLHEGSIRRIIVKNEEGHTVVEVPLALGIIGAIVVPVLAAIGAIAALAAHWRIVVVREVVEERSVPADHAAAVE